MEDLYNELWYEQNSLCWYERYFPWCTRRVCLAGQSKISVFSHFSVFCVYCNRQRKEGVIIVKRYGCGLCSTVTFACGVLLGAIFPSTFLVFLLCILILFLGAHSFFCWQGGVCDENCCSKCPENPARCPALDFSNPKDNKHLLKYIKRLRFSRSLFRYTPRMMGRIIGERFVFWYKKSDILLFNRFLTVIQSTLR